MGRRMVGWVGGEGKGDGFEHLEWGFYKGGGGQCKLLMFFGAAVSRWLYRFICIHRTRYLGLNLSCVFSTCG